MALAGCLACFLPACSPPEPSQPSSDTSEPSPTPRSVSPPPSSAPEPPPPAPTPSLAPVKIPSKRLETAKLFNGVQVQSNLISEKGSTATAEKASAESYVLDLQLKVRVPEPATSLDRLTALNPALGTLLPSLPAMLETAKVSPFYEKLYGLKLAAAQRNLTRLDMLPSRHNFFDCETILELQHTESGRQVLLIQADMDVDADGSDADRAVTVDGTPKNYQPMTSYRWPKKTANVNQFVPEREARLKKLEQEFAKKGLSIEKNRELRDQLIPLRYEVNQLKKNSFLISVADPFMVIPGSMFNEKGSSYSPKLGDFCAVIHKNTIYPAIVGDIGPAYKMGEASLRLCKAIAPDSTAYSRPATALEITYLIFPNTADTPADAPNLQRWETRVKELLAEIGAKDAPVHHWEDVTKPQTSPAGPAAAPTATPSAPAVAPPGDPIHAPTPEPTPVPPPVEPTPAASKPEAPAPEEAPAETPAASEPAPTPPPEPVAGP